MLDSVLGVQGRLLVFMVKDFKLQLVSEREVKGAVYNVNPFQVPHHLVVYSGCASVGSPSHLDLPQATSAKGRLEREGCVRSCLYRAAV